MWQHWRHCHHVVIIIVQKNLNMLMTVGGRTPRFVVKHPILAFL
jgi:hypothetical protein